MGYVPTLSRIYALHPESVQQYDALKRELATKYGSDRAAYTDMKASFIRSIIRAAVVEAMSEKKKTANKESL